MSFSRYMRKVAEHPLALCDSRNQMCDNRDRFNHLVHSFLLCRQQVEISAGVHAATNLSAESISSTVILVWRVLETVRSATFRTLHTDR